jgi:hypothetical protein
MVLPAIDAPPLRDEPPHIHARRRGPIDVQPRRRRRSHTRGNRAERSLRDGMPPRPGVAEARLVHIPSVVTSWRDVQSEVHMLWNWIGSHNGIIALIIAALAAALSLTNTLLNRRYRRQDAYLKMHELLTDPEIQQGRRLISRIGRTGELPEIDSDEHIAISRTLVTHNNLAMFIRRGVISKRWVLDAWHHTLRELEAGTAVYISRRRQIHRWRVYSELEQLIADAVNYKSNQPCCQGDETFMAGTCQMPPLSERESHGITEAGT